MSTRSLLGLVACIAAGCGKAAAPTEETAPPSTVKWEGPALTALEEWTELFGTTIPLPDRVARVTAPVEGRVQSIFSDTGSSPVVEGQRVEKGTVLVQLDPTVVQAALAKAEAGQEVTKEEQQQTQFAVELAKAEIERLKQLQAMDEKTPGGPRGLVTPIARLQAEYALKDAESKKAAAAARLAAGIKEQESLRAQLKLHTLAAPIAGRVGRILVVRGQTLSVGTPVADIIDIDDQIDVLCFVPPSLVGKLKLGQAARTGGFDAGPVATVEAEGEIVFIAEQAEPETGNFAVKVRLSNKEVHLRANRVLRIRVLTGPGKECLNIKESAIQEDDEQPTVVIVTDVKTQTNADGKEETVGIARRLKVTLGMRDRTLHQIELLAVDDPEKDPAKKWSGIIKDALFVVEGGQGLQTGDAVKLEVEVD
ncbi:MAG TPA: efflux RND transporter periplasmic adaptor subunit [Gemmataceae bacterium]|jgi:RND family efflux transporter MFP subunit|nr:efflux RND transporter periplasmic adaptor subunit [Gemmataceae bacterium]